MPQLALVDLTDDDVLAEGASVLSVSDARALVKLFAQVSSSRNADRFCDRFTKRLRSGNVLGVEYVNTLIRGATPPLARTG